ncbi:MAG: hypothetical protein H7Z13_00575 [Ferruginibacter sp.]|nr:hypothetical protein [Ferruginibacter sp.]
MQLKNLFIAGLLSVIAFASCSKKNDDIPLVSIEGDWVGKYSVLSGPYNNYYSFKIKAGGVLELQDAAGQKTGEGSWQFSNANTVIFGTYSHLPPANGKFSFIANFNSTTGKIDGTWGNDLKEYGGGYWFMNKTN